MSGIANFKGGLELLGYKPQALPDKPDHLYFPYKIQSGIFMGKEITLGLVIPDDFPMSWPSGPMICPHLKPINTSGVHPNGAIHEDHAKPYKDILSGSWQYWSRPYPSATFNKKTVAAYMSHIWRLMDSQ